MFGLCFLTGELGHVQIVISAFSGYKLIMITHLYYLTLIHNNDAVCILDCGKSVGDDKAGSVLHKIYHGILNLLLCSCINA